jgi:hypothetical protein
MTTEIKKTRSVLKIKVISLLLICFMAFLAQEAEAQNSDRDAIAEPPERATLLYSFDDALHIIVDEIIAQAGLTDGGRVTVARIRSDSYSKNPRLSNFVKNRIEGMLLERGVNVLLRPGQCVMALLREIEELGFSDFFDPSTTERIGGFENAPFIISGDFTTLSASFDFRASIIHVATGRYMARHRLPVIADTFLVSFSTDPRFITAKENALRAGVSSITVIPDNENVPAPRFNQFASEEGYAMPTVIFRMAGRDRVVAGDEIVLTEMPQETQARTHPHFETCIFCMFLPESPQHDRIIQNINWANPNCRITAHFTVRDAVFLAGALPDAQGNAWDMYHIPNETEIANIVRMARELQRLSTVWSSVAVTSWLRPASVNPGRIDPVTRRIVSYPTATFTHISLTNLDGSTHNAMGANFNHWMSGADNSARIAGYAVDVVHPRGVDLERWLYNNWAGGVGSAADQKGFTHIDLGSRRRWVYSCEAD